MSFGYQPPELHPPTLLLYRCQRAGCLHSVPCTGPADVALRRAIEAGELHTVHTCADGGSGCCRLIGTGPGTQKTEAA